MILYKQPMLIGLCCDFQTQQQQQRYHVAERVKSLVLGQDNHTVIEKYHPFIVTYLLGGNKFFLVSSMSGGGRAHRFHVTILICTFFFSCTHF